MARFDRYLLRQLLTLFGFFALVLVLIYWINRAVALFDQIIADGQSAGAFLELTMLSLPNIIRIVLPLSTFVAAVYVTNRLTADSEMVVVQATGFSPFRLARPVFVFGVIGLILTGILTHLLVPYAAARTSVLQSQIAETASARLLQEGRFLSPTAGITIYVREVTPAGELRDIFISDSRSAVESLLYTASSAYLVRAGAGPQLVMIEGMVQSLRHADQRLFTTSFVDLAYDLGALMATETRSGRSARELGTFELLRPSEALMAETGRSAGQLLIDGHDRFAQPLLALVGAMLGFAALMTGGFSRFGLWRQIAMAVVLVILVKMIEASCVSAVRGDAGLWPLIYLPATIGLATSGLLLLWAARTHRPRQVPDGVPA